MGRIIRYGVLFTGVCCAFSACTRPAAVQVITNEVKEYKHIPTLESNFAANVSVYCFWRNPADNDTSWDIEYGVVLDGTHVLTTRCGNSMSLNGWEQSYLESVTIGPPDAKNESGVGPWQAYQIAGEDEENNLVILATYSSIPLPSVVISTEVPERNSLLYTFTRDSNSMVLGIGELLTIYSQMDAGTMPMSVESKQEKGFSVLIPSDGDLRNPTGVFNQQHEFVGFVLNGSWDYPVPLHAPEKFKTDNGWGDGYNVAGTTGKALKSLFHQANILLYYQQPQGGSK